MPRYEVVFEPDGGETMSHEYTAADESHAKDLARSMYPHENIEAVYELPEEPVRHPEIEVSGAHVRQHPLTSVKTALRIGGVPAIEILDFEDEALTVQDYTEEMLKVIKRWVTIT